MTEQKNHPQRVTARKAQEPQPESGVRGIAGRMQCLARRSRHIDDMDTPLSFKVQYGGEERQGRRDEICRLEILDFRLKTLYMADDLKSLKI